MTLKLVIVATALLVLAALGVLALRRRPEVPDPRATDHPWRTHPMLQRLFLPEYPDDLQVIVHDGGPRATKRAPELMWLRVVRAREDGAFVGTLLNEPKQLATVKLGDAIPFIPTGPGRAPVRVSEKYLRERPAWNIHACNKCGLGELFDAPSDLVKILFPGSPPESIEMFTTFCGECGGVQVVERQGR